MIGMGGGGDVVGALAVVRLCEAWGTPAVLGGVAWERIVVDPRPGPRPPDEIVGGRELGSHARLADGDTATADGVRFSEALMAEHTGEEILLLDVTGGPAGVRDGIAAAAAALDTDLVVLADVGGDVLATGSEPGLASPLCDAVVLAGAVELAEGGGPGLLLAVIGAGCDGELEPHEVEARVAASTEAGASLATERIAPEVADELEAAANASYTEASMMVVRCVRGEEGPVPIRGGRRSVTLSRLGGLVFFLDPLVALEETAPLAAAVKGTESIDEACSRLSKKGIRTELDFERERASKTR